MVLLAVQEWARYGRQTITYPVTARRTPSSKASRSAMRPSASTTTGRASAADLSGLDDRGAVVGAFISWDIESAGVPRDLFCPDARHTIYVERMVERRAGRAPRSFPPCRRARAAGRRPDLRSRDDGGDTTLENLNRGPGHCDIVVEVAPAKCMQSAAMWATLSRAACFHWTASGF
jgi:hypothetical protein